jgi:hypothetical protein
VTHQTAIPAAPLKASQFTLRRLFLYVHVVSVTCSAFVGIGQILTRHDRDFRVLLTAVTIALASLSGLGCGVALEGKRARFLPLAGLVLTLVGAASWIAMIWYDPLTAGQGWIKATLVASVYAVACAHASLLSVARLAPRYSWASFVALVAIFTVATLISWPIVIDRVLSDWLVRWIAVAAIIDAMMSVLIPIFHLLSRAELKARGADAMPSLDTIDKEIAKLEERLAELKRMRESAVQSR